MPVQKKEYCDCLRVALARCHEKSPQEAGFESE
jgi:hypothetical protein